MELPPRRKGRRIEAGGIAPLVLEWRVIIPEQEREAMQNRLGIRIVDPATEDNPAFRGRGGGRIERRNANPFDTDRIREVLSGKRQPSSEGTQATPGEREQPLSKRTQSEDWLVILKERNDRRI